MSNNRLDERGAKSIFGSKRFLLALMAVTVPVAGEFSFHPFRDDFRVSLGTPAFFLFLLWLRSVPPLVSGVLVGGSVTIFRMALELAPAPDSGWDAAFLHHYPVFFYYFTYAAAFAAFRMNRHHDRPLLLGLLGAAIELAATLAELSFRYSSIRLAVTLAAWNQIVLIAFFRSFFVVGYFNLVKLRQTRAAEAQQRKANEKMLMLITGLYEESLQLKKTLHNAETIAQESYELYQSLKDAESPELEDSAGKALRIAGQVHEIKKDNQRIFAGLSSMITHESDYLPVEELTGIVMRSNRKYARSLGRNIDFSVQTEGELPPCHVYATLSLLNNLVANAVEAIEDEGMIAIGVKRVAESVVFRVADNGPGIAPKYRERIFMPGYTTKFDPSGNPSTGIGLAYVKQETERLSGTVHVEAGSGGEGAVFTIALPVSRVGKEE